MNLHKHQLYLLEQQFGQQLLVLTLRVNSWLWNWAQGLFNPNKCFMIRRVVLTNTTDAYVYHT